MPHTHFCDVCKIEVAHCSDNSCFEDPSHANAAGHHNGGGDRDKAALHYCSQHHPDPKHFVAPTPPLSRFREKPL